MDKSIDEQKLRLDALDKQRLVSGRVQWHCSAARRYQCSIKTGCRSVAKPVATKYEESFL